MIFRSKKNNTTFYKFKSLKVYASTEWLADGKKKYRTVFDTSEVTYLYVELSFYNKLFDEEDWDITANLRCFRLLDKSRKEQICDIYTDLRISKEDAVIQVREGWGHKDKGFWTRGDYIWEVYMEHEFIGKKYFYIEDGGTVEPDDNPYFEINSTRLYEGPNMGIIEKSRKYYTRFKGSEVRYIWTELNIENLQTSSWYCELFFYFYNEAGQLKGHTTELKKIQADDEEVAIVTGWGSDTKGSWFLNNYRIEIVFMDKLIGVIPFEIGEEFTEGTTPILRGNAMARPTLPSPKEVQESLDELMTELNQLVGLGSVKRRIHDYVNYLKFLQLRKKQGFDEDENINLHIVFKGNPGTGKTTIARMLGKIYHKLGLLSTGEVLEVGRAELIGQFIGQTAPKVKEMIDAARGGVLFIDEAYSLVRNKDDNKDYGQEVIETLVKEMSDGQGDLAVVMAGYPKGMDVLLNSNPGLQSRIAITFSFPDFLPQELSRIVDIAAQKQGVTFTDEARKLLDQKIIRKYRQRDESFGNARLIYRLVEESKMQLGIRVMQAQTPDELPKDALQFIEIQDIEKVFEKEDRERPDINIDEPLLLEAMSELDELIGLKEVKKQIRELSQLVRFYRETNKDVLNHFSLHTIFKGNPGTGKTTVARIIAKIYQALGILERGHIVEADRQALVAGFVGQTALKTKEKIDQAHGGILFIDEAYALNASDGTNDFGKEALEVIIKQMEDKRSEFIIIAAGYPKNMDNFLEMNPGLKSRFDKVIDFEDFTSEELFQIALSMLKKEQLIPDAEAHEFLQFYLKRIHTNKDVFFGNARSVRKIVTDAIKNQHLRMSKLRPAERKSEIIQTLMLADLKELTKEEKFFGKGRIGFGVSN